MSAALLRQSLELVDSEGFAEARKKRRVVKKASGEVVKKPNKKSKKGRAIEKAPEQRVEENVKRLQALSTPTLNKAITDKILERATKGRALVDKIEVPIEDNKPILFTEETFKQFEKELFCS